MISTQQGYMDMSKHPEWRGNGINRLRVDFSSRVGDHVEVDCIRQVGADPRPSPVWDYRFDTGASQGWDTWHDIANLSFAEGQMAGTATSGAARIYGPTTYSSFEGDAEPVISLRMKVSAGRLSLLYFYAVGVPFGQATRVDFVPIADGQWHSYEVDMSGNANWAGHRVYRLRLDPTNAVGASFAVDWIRTTEPEQQPLRALRTTLNPEIFRMHASDADPYGIQWRELYAGGAENEPHGFTGQEDEAELDLYHYGARLYMPQLGRFLAVDPMREFANPYSYVGNNPVFFLDSNGEYSINAGNLNDEQRRLVLVALAVMTGLSADYTCDQAGNMVYKGLYFDEIGDLQIAENAIIHGGSQTALSSLSDFINSPAKATLNSASVPSLKDEIAFGSASIADKLMPLMKTTTIDFDDFNALSALLFSKNIPKESFGLGTVLFHEFHHNFFDSTDPEVDGPMGAAVEYVNEIRHELGLPMRKQYQGQIIKNRPGWYSIDFFVIVKGKQRHVGRVLMNYKLVAPKKYK